MPPLTPRHRQWDAVSVIGRQSSRDSDSYGEQMQQQQQQCQVTAQCVSHGLTAAGIKYAVCFDVASAQALLTSQCPTTLGRITSDTLTAETL